MEFPPTDFSFTHIINLDLKKTQQLGSDVTQQAVLMYRLQCDRRPNQTCPLLQATDKSQCWVCSSQDTTIQAVRSHVPQR